MSNYSAKHCALFYKHFTQGQSLTDAEWDFLGEEDPNIRQWVRSERERAARSRAKAETEAARRAAQQPATATCADEHAARIFAVAADEFLPAFKRAMDSGDVQDWEAAIARHAGTHVPLYVLNTFALRPLLASLAKNRDLEARLAAREKSSAGATQHKGMWQSGQPYDCDVLVEWEGCTWRSRSRESPARSNFTSGGSDVRRTDDPPFIR
jgi:hypothetical protein